MRWILLFICAVGFADPGKTWQQEVSSIDQQIIELREAQNKMRASAERKANNAMRWQFQNENYPDARRAWDEVAAQKEKIREMQERIDQLEARKQEILRENAG